VCLLKVVVACTELKIDTSHVAWYMPLINAKLP
jgi:hypothetical protein